MSGARKRNVGWRIDYFYVTEGLMPSISNAWIAQDTMGSENCPIIDLKEEVSIPQVVFYLITFLLVMTLSFL